MLGETEPAGTDMKSSLHVVFRWSQDLSACFLITVLLRWPAKAQAHQMPMDTSVQVLGEGSLEKVLLDPRSSCEVLHSRSAIWCWKLNLKAELPQSNPHQHTLRAVSLHEKYWQTLLMACFMQWLVLCLLVTIYLFACVIPWGKGICVHNSIGTLQVCALRTWL